MKRLITLLSLLLITQWTFGQLSGTKNIPGDYATITEAVVDLNAQGAIGGGGVTFNVAAGHVETITVPISLTATGTSDDQIIFQKSGDGDNPKITAYTTGAGTPSIAVQDGIWNLVGSDYVTIDGIDLYDPNVANPATMEYGFAMFKASVSNGCQYNTIKNCTVTLNRVNNSSGSGPSAEGSRAINVSNALVTAQTTNLTPTAASGTNSYNNFYNNTLQNCNYGIVLMGYAAATPFTLGDTGNDIGGISSGTGNTIKNYGGGGTSSPAAGVRANNQWGVNISNNTINNNDGAGVNHASTLRGIFAQAGTSASATISYNTVTVKSGASSSLLEGIDNGIGSTAAGNTVNIHHNTVQNCTYTTATSGNFVGIYNNGTAATVNIYSNLVTGNTLAGTGSFTGIETTGVAGGNYNVYSNTVSGNQKTGASGTMYCTRAGTGNVYYYLNDVNNNSFTATSGTSSCILYGYYNFGSPLLENLYNNSFYNLSVAGTNTASGSLLNGIYTNTVATATKNIYGNTIRNFSAISGTVNGIAQYLGTSVSIYKNNIYNLSNSGGNGVVYGLAISSGAVTAYNNFISDLKAPAANVTDAIRGINITSSTSLSTIGIYFNTVYLNATSTGANFGTTGIYHTYSLTATTATLDMRNNVIVNLSTPNGTGLVVAFRRSSSTNLNNFGTNSNNNDLFTDALLPNRLIFYDGTNSDPTIAAYKTRVAPRESASFSENPPFENVASTPYDLRIQTEVPTQCEGAGATGTIVIDDFEGDLRLDPPDVGADEFDGIPLPLCDAIPETSTITGQSVVCYNTGTTLGLSVVYEDMGITYQWAYSTTPGGPYVNLLGTAPSQATGNLTVTTYYVCTVTCTYTNESMTTAEFAVAINALPTVEVSPTSGSYCSPGGAPVTLTASGATTYAWSPAAGLDVTTGPIVNASPGATTTYTVTGTDLNGCTSTATSTITVNPAVYLTSVSASPSIICPGAGSTLTAVAGTTADYIMSSATFGLITPTGTVTTLPTGDDALLATVTLPFNFSFYGSGYSSLYIYSNGFVSFSSGQPTGSPYTAAIPTVATPNNFIAISHDDLNVTVAGQMKYFIEGTTPNQVFVVDYNNVRYYNSAANNGNLTGQIQLFEADGHIEIQVQNSVDPTLSVKTLGIENSGGTAGYSPATRNNIAYDITTPEAWKFTPSGGTLSYSWSESPLSGTLTANTGNPVTATNITSSNTYTVVVTEINSGCSVSGSVTVNTGAPLFASVTSPLRCSGDVTTPITGSQTGGAPDFTYTWAPIDDLYVDAGGTDDYDGAAMDSPTIYTKAYMPTTYYLLTVTDNCGTWATAVSTVTVNQTPTASASSNGPVCTGETLELYGTTDIGSSFGWTGPDGFMSDLLNPTIPLSTTAASGTYYFTATSNGCPSTVASVEVVVNQTPTALSITPANPMICPGSVQQLVAIGGQIPEEDVILLAEDFNDLDPTGWTHINESTGGDDPAAAAWTLYLSGGSVISNDNSFYAMSNSDAQGSGSITHTKLMTPVLNTTNFTSLTLSFWHNFNWFGTPDSAKIEVSTNGGVSWIYPPVIAYYGADQGSGTSWVNANIDLSAYVNQPNLQIRFRYKAVWGFWWTIDNVIISGDKLVPSEITWFPFDNLYLDSDALIPYNGESTPTVYAEIVTSETYTATATSDADCSSAATATVTGVDYTVSGTLKYNNNAKTPMNNVTLTLNPGGYTAITDGSGNYLFEDICADEYTLEVTNINKPVGGINSTDAIQMNKWVANQAGIQQVKFLAGEVDYDGSVSINSTDALAVQNYFVFGTEFNRADIFDSPWVFWKAGDLILNNFDPNRFLVNFPVAVTNSNITVDLYGQCIGDFSGSFTPGGLKGASATMELVDLETRLAGPGVEINLPVHLVKTSAVSAISLIMEFPSDLLKVTGVSMNENEVQPSWSVNGNELRIGWNSLQPLWLEANGNLMTIHIVTSEAFSQGESIRFELAADPLNELADGNFNVIPDAVIGMDAIEFSVYGIGEPGDGSAISLQVRPNPFTDYTFLNYGIPANGHVTLQVNDMLGRKVSVLVDEYQTIGNYSVKLDAVPLQPGVYTATITLRTNSGDRVRTIKLIRK